MRTTLTHAPTPSIRLLARSVTQSLAPHSAASHCNMQTCFAFVLHAAGYIATYTICYTVHMLQTFPGEESNMILARCWKEEPEDTHLKLLVDTLLDVYKDLGKNEDVRTLSAKVSQVLQLGAISHLDQVGEHNGYPQGASSPRP